MCQYRSMERDRGGRPRYPGIITPAEQRVLEELRKGGTNAEIAIRLGIGPETVKTHIANMFDKLDLPDRHALAAWRPEEGRRLRWLLVPPLKPLIGLGVAVLVAWACITTFSAPALRVVQVLRQRSH